MDPSAGAPPPEKSGTEPSFRKLSADAANRKYRRRLSSGRSDSSSAEDGPERKRNSKRGRSRSPVENKEGHSKETENWRRKDNSRVLERESSHARSGRGRESGRHSDRHSYGTSRGSKRHDDYRSYHDRHADGNEQSHPRSSRSCRDSRSDNYSDHSRPDSISDRSRGDSKYGDKSDNPEHRSKNKEKEIVPREHQRYDDGEHDRSVDGRKQTYSTRDYRNDRERGEKRDRYRTPEKYKDDYASSREEYKGYTEEKEKSKNKETVEQEEVPRKRNGRYGRGSEAETRDERRSLFGCVGPDVKNDQYLEGKLERSRMKSSTAKATFGYSEDGKPPSSSKQVVEASDRAISNNTEAGASDDVNAAKVAAMKAAELVNRNIVGFGGVGTGHLSTDQKKKLLWGNKKSNVAEETTKHWDLNLFSDRERQEKFNKLMSLRMPWCLWPIVGCEGQCGSREQGRQQGRKPGRSQEAGGARYGPGEALHSWSSSERWSNSWSRPLVNSAYLCSDIQTLKSMFCTHSVGLFTLLCGSFINCHTSVVELDYFLARKELGFW